MGRRPDKGPNPILTTFAGIAIWFVLTEGLGRAGLGIAELIDNDDVDVHMKGLTAGRTLGFFVFLVGAVGYALSQFDKSGRN